MENAAILDLTMPKGSTRLADGNGAGAANDVNVTTKIMPGNFFRPPAPQI